MLLKAALATGKRVALPGITYEGNFYFRDKVEDMMASGDLSLDNALSDGWVVEETSTVKFTEAQFKTIWNEVAGEFTSIKTFEESKLAKKLLGHIVSGYKV